MSPQLAMSLLIGSLFGSIGLFMILKGRKKGVIEKDIIIPNRFGPSVRYTGKEAVTMGIRLIVLGIFMIALAAFFIWQIYSGQTLVTW